MPFYLPSNSWPSDFCLLATLYPHLGGQPSTPQCISGSRPLLPFQCPEYLKAEVPRTPPNLCIGRPAQNHQYPMRGAPGVETQERVAQVGSQPFPSGDRNRAALFQPSRPVGGPLPHTLKPFQGSMADPSGQSQGKHLLSSPGLGVGVAQPLPSSRPFSEPFPAALLPWDPAASCLSSSSPRSWFLAPQSPLR